MLLAALSLVLTSNAASAQITVDRSSSARAERRDLRAPDIAVWIDRFSYRPGQRIRPFFQSDDGAFVTIIRVSTTGDLTVLYPHRPSQQVAYRTDALRDDEVPYWNDLPFFVNEAEGVGFVVAIASYEPFDYRRVSNRDRWDTWQLSSGAYRSSYGLHAYPDPYELVGSFIDRTLPANAEYSTDYIQYQVVRDYLYQRRYSNYNDLYYNCLSIYLGHADYYCSQYATYGYPIYVPIFIARYPAPQRPPNGTPPDENRPKLRDRTIGDPVVTGGIENGPKTAQRSPTSAEVERADAQRTWWNAQRRDNSRRGMVLDRPRIDPNATTVPQVYRSSPSQPRVESAPSRRSEPRVESTYEPMRSEPARRAEPQREHVPVMRSEPAPQGKYERPMQSAPVQSAPVQSAPVQSAPVIRSEIPRVEVRPAPPPPTQVHSEPVQSKPVVPPPAPSVKDQ
jgi:hypothetical protein